MALAGGYIVWVALASVTGFMSVPWAIVLFPAYRVGMAFYERHRGRFQKPLTQGEILFAVVFAIVVIGVLALVGSLLKG